jgi:hypothetical protein
VVALKSNEIWSFTIYGKELVEIWKTITNELRQKYTTPEELGSGKDIYIR